MHGRLTRQGVRVLTGWLSWWKTLFVTHTVFVCSVVDRVRKMRVCFSSDSGFRLVLINYRIQQGDARRQGQRNRKRNGLTYTTSSYLFLNRLSACFKRTQ